MSTKGIGRLGNYVWDDTNNTWIKEPSPDSHSQSVIISGVTADDGKLQISGIVDSLPLNNTIKASDTTVSATEVALPATPLAGRKTICIFNNHATTQIFIGATGLSTSDGFPLQGKAYITLDADDNIAIYGIAAADIDVRVLECK